MEFFFPNPTRSYYEGLGMNKRRQVKRGWGVSYMLLVKSLYGPVDVILYRKKISGAHLRG